MKFPGRITLSHKIIAICAVILLITLSFVLGACFSIGVENDDFLKEVKTEQIDAMMKNFQKEQSKFGSSMFLLRYGVQTNVSENGDQNNGQNASQNNNQNAGSDIFELKKDYKLTFFTESEKKHYKIEFTHPILGKENSFWQISTKNIGSPKTFSFFGKIGAFFRSSLPVVGYNKFLEFISNSSLVKGKDGSAIVLVNTKTFSIASFDHNFKEKKKDIDFEPSKSNSLNISEPDKVFCIFLLKNKCEEPAKAQK